MSRGFYFPAFILGCMYDCGFFVPYDPTKVCCVVLLLYCVMLYFDFFQVEPSSFSFSLLFRGWFGP